MKLNTIDKILYVLKNDENQVEVSEEKRIAAMKPLDRMLEMAK